MKHLTTKSLRESQSGIIIVKFFWWPLIISIVLSIILTLVLNLVF